MGVLSGSVLYMADFNCYIVLYYMTHEVCFHDQVMARALVGCWEPESERSGKKCFSGPVGLGGKISELI